MALWAMFRAFGAVHELYRVGDEIERIGGRPPRQLADHLRGRQRV